MKSSSLLSSKGVTILAERTRPPRSVEELIPYIEEHGIHLHYGLAMDRWMYVGVDRRALKYCAPETCYRLKIKNHREEADE